MPPKKPPQGPSKKTIEKKQTKVIEDKTFGLKNKKGAKTQKFIQQVEKQVILGNKTAKELDQAKRERNEKKEAKLKEQEELNELFKPIAELQKVAAGVDPKSVLCAFFKQGICKKGDKCKFSHDLAIERKAEKRNLYDGDVPKNDNTMEDWDQAKLEDVVLKKHGVANKGLPPTTIICKYFLDAVEGNKYGWFWECPNGESCHYKHALPPGFMLKKDKKKLEEQKEIISLEDLIERERQNLGLELTKVTFESFIVWKKRKRAEKLALLNNEKAKRQTDFKHGRTVGISGREMFEFNPDFAKEQMDEDDADVFDSKLREKDDDEYEGPVRDIDFDTFDLQNGNKNTIAIDEDLFNDSDLDEELDNLEIED